MSDVVAEIKKSCSPEGKFDLKTAEGRAEWDDLLRKKLLEIKEGDVRAHSKEMIRAWRRDILYDQKAGWQCPACMKVYAPWVEECKTDHSSRPKELRRLKG